MNDLKTGIEILIKEIEDEEKEHEEHEDECENCGLKKLIKEEEDAIASYAEQIENYKDDPNIVSRLEEIKRDEEEHLKELTELIGTENKSEEKEE